MKLELKKTTLIALGFLTGCAGVGPNYHQPDILSERNPKAFINLDQGLYSSDQPDKNWWKLFNDDHINQVVEEALKANTDLRVAFANLERARSAISEIQGSRIPTTTISGSATRGVSPSAGSPATPVAINPYPTMNTFDAGISANWDLDLFGRLRRTLEASRAEADAIESTYRLTKITVVANTVRAYTDACSFGRQLAVARNSFEKQQEGVKLVERSLQAGRGTPLDVARSRSLLFQLEAALSPLEAQRQLALYRLATLTGKPPGEFPASAASCESFPKTSKVIPIGDGVSLLRRRPDVRIAERRLAVATAGIGVATATLFPTISFGGSAGYTAHEVKDLGTDPSHRFSLGPLLSWSFPNVVASRARVAGAKASTRAALANFDGTVLSALREVESALASYRLELDRRSKLEVARDEAQKLLDLSRRLLKAGAGNYLDVIDAERTLASAEATLASSDAAVAANRVALFLALGGGWE